MLDDALDVDGNCEPRISTKVLGKVVRVQSEITDHVFHQEIVFIFSGGVVRTDGNVNIHGNCSVCRRDKQRSGSNTFRVETPPLRSGRLLVNRRRVGLKGRLDETVKAVGLQRAVGSFPFQASVGSISTSALAIDSTFSKTKTITHEITHSIGDGAGTFRSVLTGKLLVDKVVIEESIGGRVVI